MANHAVRDLATSELIDQLRRAASVWFRNDHLLLLEEMIRRLPREQAPAPAAPEAPAQGHA